MMDFAHPRSGAQLDASLIARAIAHGIKITRGDHRKFIEQLAGKGELVSVLYVEPGSRMHRIPQAIVRVYHPEGFEMTDRATALHVLALRQLLGKG